MRTNTKKLFAVLLTVCLVASLFVMPATAVPTKQYVDFNDDHLLNGDFEIGVVGMNPYGWGLQSFENNFKFSTSRDFTTNFKFTTSMDGDKKVAELKKNGAGYTYIVSSKIPVWQDANNYNDYHISFDYRIAELDFRPYADCSQCTDAGLDECTFYQHWTGITTNIRQYDKDGNILDANGNISTDTVDTQAIYRTPVRDLNLGHDVMTDYETVDYTVSLNSNTAYVVLYIGFGTYNNIAFPKVYFDNVKFEQLPNNHLFNGDFEDTTAMADGGRTIGVAGPLGWISTGVNGTGTPAAKTTGYYTNGCANYKAVISTETDAQNNINHYAEFSLKDSLLIGGTGQSSPKYYNLMQSNKMLIPVGAGETFTVKFKFKSYTSDGSSTMTHPSYSTASFRVNYYNANGERVHMDRTYLAAKVDSWTDYSHTSTVPSNAAYYTISFYQGGNSADIVNAVYCFDNFNINYTVKDESEAEDSEWTELSVNAAGVPMDNTTVFNDKFSMTTYTDAVRGDVIRLVGANRTSRQNCPGYVMYTTGEKIPLAAGEKIVVSFDYKATGYAFSLRQQYMVDSTIYEPPHPNALGPQVLIHFYNANDEYIGKESVSGAKWEDYGWTSTMGGKIAPANTAYIKWGIAIYSGNKGGSAWIEHYYDNIVVKREDDSYWASADHADHINNMKVNLFDKVIMNGIDVNGDEETGLADLLKFNEYYVSGTYNEAADVNKNGKLDDEDLTILRWCLMGVDAEEEETTGFLFGDAAESLKDKTAVFFGDSITEAYYSWALQMSHNYGMVTTNAGIRGASVSTAMPNNRVVTQMNAHKNKTYDYVILHGGTNDGQKSQAVGTMSDSYELSSFNTATFAGGLEELFYNAYTNFPDAKIGFIVNYAIPLGTYGNIKNMDPYYDLAKEICDKWNITYIDIYAGTIPGTNISYSYDLLDMDKGIYGETGAEDVHINGSGYELLAPHIGDWMATMKQNVNPLVAE